MKITFFHRALAWLGKVFKNTDWTHAAQTTISLAAPLVETIAAVTLVPAVASEVTLIINTIKSDFGVVATTLAQVQVGSYGVNTMTLLVNTLNAIKSNLQSLLTVADIKDANTRQEVTIAVNTIVGEIEAILGSITPSAPVAAAA